MSSSGGSITALLARWRDGDQDALGDLTPLIYNELHRLARGYLRNERGEHTLQPTALVNEVYIRLAEQSMPDWKSRAHFIGVSAQLMRQVLVDYSRKHRAGKRASGQSALELSEKLLIDERAVRVLALDEALAALQSLDPLKARLVELRYFGGLTAAEMVTVTGVSTATITREMRLAEAWLAHRLGGSPEGL